MEKEKEKEEERKKEKTRTLLSSLYTKVKHAYCMVQQFYFYKLYTDV
jgi:hypothetical protein